MTRFLQGEGFGNVLMEGAGDGGAGGGGGAGEGAGAGGGAGDGAGGAGDGAGGGVPGAAGSAGGDNWLSGVADEGLREWGQAKGWKDVGSVLQSAKHLESMVGAPAEQIVRIPAGGMDRTSEQGRDFLQRLGMPAEASGYELAPAGAEVDEGYDAWARQTFHDLGLTADQASKLAAAHGEYLTSQETAMDETSRVSVEAGERELEKLWGNGKDHQIRVAGAAMQELGVTGEMLEGMEDAIGYAETMKWAAKVADRMGEDKFVGGGGDGNQGGFNTGMTPEKAKQAYQARLSDPAFKSALMDRMHPNHKGAMQEKQELFSVIYPD